MPTSAYSTYSLESRQGVSHKMRTAHPDRVPIIVIPKSPQLQLDTNKFLVPADITLSKFLLELRRHIKALSSHSAIYLGLEDGSLPSVMTQISLLDAKHRNVDGFLYLTICEENTFGGTHCVELPRSSIGRSAPSLLTQWLRA